MVRLVPARLARLVTLALQARVHHEGLAPAALGLAGAPPLPQRVLPAVRAGPPAAPTGYRSSRRAASEVEPEAEVPERTPRAYMRRILSLTKTKKKGDGEKAETKDIEGTADGDAFLYFFHDVIRNAPVNTIKDHVQASKLTGARWATMTPEQREPYVKLAEERQLTRVALAGELDDEDQAAADRARSDKSLDEAADFAAFIYYLFDEIRGRGLGSSRVRAFTMALSKWNGMPLEAKAPYVEASGGGEKAPKKESQWRKFFREARGTKKNSALDAMRSTTGEGDAFLCYLYDQIRNMPEEFTLQPLQAFKLADAQWKLMPEDSKEPYVSMAEETQPYRGKSKARIEVDDEEDFAAFLKFLFERVRAAGAGSSQVGSFTMASSMWYDMVDEEKARYFSAEAFKK